MHEHWWARVWRRAGIMKHVHHQIQSSESSGLLKVLGLGHLLFLGTGSIVGAGIYVILGISAHEIAGPSIVLSYIVAAVAALLAGLCFAEYAVEVPVSGGAFVYASVTFGELVAWTVAWSMSLETTLSSAAVSKGFSGYLGSLLFSSPEGVLKYSVGPFQLDFFALLLIAVLTVVLMVGIKESATFNACVCLMNVSCILYVVCAGLPHADPSSNMNPFTPYGIHGMFSGASIVFFSYVGFDYIANTADEAKNPTRDLPLSILGSILLAVVLYSLMSLTLVMMIPYTDINILAPFSAAFDSKGMRIPAYIVSIGALCGIITSTMTGLLSQTRLLTVLGREGYLPSPLATVHKRTNTPVIATIVTGCTSGALAFLMDINSLAELVSMGTLYIFLFVCLGVIFKRHHWESHAPLSHCIAHLLWTISSCLGISISYILGASWLIIIGFGTVYVASCLFAQYHKPFLSSSPQQTSFRVPFFPWIPSFGVFFCLHLMCSLSWISYVAYGAFMVLGLAVYAFDSTKRVDQHDQSLDLNSQAVHYTSVPQQHVALEMIPREGASSMYHNSDAKMDDFTCTSI